MPLLALGSRALPYVTWSKRGRQEGKNTTCGCSQARLRWVLGTGGMKMKGTRREMGRNGTHVKSRLIPLAPHSSVFSPRCGCWAQDWRTRLWGEAAGERHPSLWLRGLISQRLSLNKFLLQPGGPCGHLLQENDDEVLCLRK